MRIENHLFLQFQALVFKPIQHFALIFPGNEVVPAKSDVVRGSGQHYSSPLHQELVDGEEALIVYLLRCNHNQNVGGIGNNPLVQIDVADVMIGCQMLVKGHELFSRVHAELSKVRIGRLLRYGQGYGFQGSCRRNV